MNGMPTTPFSGVSTYCPFTFQSSFAASIFSYYTVVGKPLVRGTRITVELILEKLAAGETVDDLLVAYPRLARDDVQAALAYAADALRSDPVR